MQSTINVGVVILAFTCRIDAVENFGFTRNATDGSATADDLAIGCEIRRDTKIFLGPTKCETETRHDFIHDHHNTRFIAKLAETGEEFRFCHDDATSTKGCNTSGTPALSLGATG